MGNRLEKAKFIGHADSGCMLASELKLRFDQGFHDEAIIVRELMSTDNYNVAIKGRGYWVYVSAARTKTTPKSYKSIDAAMSEIQKIGFQAASIDLK